MKMTHMSAWEQEEYALGGRTPAMMEHLTQCAGCRDGVDQLQQGIVLFRDAAMAWSEACLETHPLRPPVMAAKAAGTVMPAWKWALAAVVLLLALMPLSRFLMRRADSAKAADPRIAAPLNSSPLTTAPLTDDALLQEVDQQVSDAVPDSMESLTHLVTTKNEGAVAASVHEGGQHVQRN